MRRSHLAIAAVAATVLLWGSAFAAIRTAVAELGPVPLSVARLVVASLVLAVVAPTCHACCSAAPPGSPATSCCSTLVR